jgi:protein disulfide-isomerase A6
LSDFAKENMENLVVRVTDDNLDSFLENSVRELICVANAQNDTAKAIMFSRKGPTSALWKSLAIDFQRKIILAQIRDTQEISIKEFNVEKFPSMVILPGGDAPGIVYSGPMERDPMYQFLSEYAPVASPPVESPSASPVFSKHQDPAGIMTENSAD